MRLFNRIKLLTPESVELEFSLAGIGSRALALSLDYTFLLLCLLLFWIIWGIISNQLLNYLESTETNYASLPIWLGAIAFLASFFIFAGYFVFFEVLWQGQTPGKRMAKIRVIRDNGRPIKMAQATLRALLRPLDDFFFVGAFLIFFGRREKRIGDWVAGTVVIQENRAQSNSGIRVSQEARQLAESLPQVVDLTQLLPDDFAVIREYLQRRDFMETQARSELSLKLARQTRAIVQLAEIPAGLTSDQFLEAIYLAYQEQFPAY
ncbi:MAG: RDD family protein [Oscillatoriophycideae cyanobacterium NC_groundwater_1537_Pr4_S-0.65um_50_18]|nr:RDD family protein [Oscillatoriophycideae cyanobacterium NC_groundwater_1537_Pr4_S-0.65um_50_18]